MQRQLATECFQRQSCWTLQGQLSWTALSWVFCKCPLSNTCTEDSWRQNIVVVDKVWQLGGPEDTLTAVGLIASTQEPELEAALRTQMLRTQVLSIRMWWNYIQVNLEWRYALDCSQGSPLYLCWSNTQGFVLSLPSPQGSFTPSLTCMALCNEYVHDSLCFRLPSSSSRVLKNPNPKWGSNNKVMAEPRYFRVQV